MSCKNEVNGSHVQRSEKWLRVESGRAGWGDCAARGGGDVGPIEHQPAPPARSRTLPKSPPCTSPSSLPACHSIAPSPFLSTSSFFLLTISPLMSSPSLISVFLPLPSSISLHLPRSVPSLQAEARRRSEVLRAEVGPAPCTPNPQLYTPNPNSQPKLIPRP